MEPLSTCTCICMRLFQQPCLGCGGSICWKLWKQCNLEATKRQTPVDFWDTFAYRIEVSTVKHWFQQRNLQSLLPGLHWTVPKIQAHSPSGIVFGCKWMKALDTFVEQQEIHTAMRQSQIEPSLFISFQSCEWTNMYKWKFGQIQHCIQQTSVCQDYEAALFERRTRRIDVENMHGIIMFELPCPFGDLIFAVNSLPLAYLLTDPVLVSGSRWSSDLFSYSALFPLFGILFKSRTWSTR